VLSCGGREIGGSRRTEVSWGLTVSLVLSLAKLLPMVTVHSPMAMAKTIFFFIIEDTLIAFQEIISCGN